MSVPIVLLPELERIALEQAARGCVSGRLIEWPALQLAFMHLGMTVDSQALAPEMRYWARKALGLTLAQKYGR